MSGLDPIGRREVRDLIASLRQEGKTVFMCSHILSDIEVLCDRVAILKRGRVAQVGHLDELRQRSDDRNRMEVLASGTDAPTLLKYLPDTEISATARGLRIEISAENDFDAVLLALRKAGGKLISVQPLKQSLEELFVDDPECPVQNPGVIESETSHFHFDVGSVVTIRHSFQHDLYRHGLVRFQFWLFGRQYSNRPLFHHLPLVIDHCRPHLKAIQRAARKITDGGVQTHHSVAQGTLCFFSFWLIKDDPGRVLLKFRRALSDRSLQSRFGVASTSARAHQKIKQKRDHNRGHYCDDNDQSATRFIRRFYSSVRPWHGGWDCRFVKTLLQLPVASRLDDLDANLPLMFPPGTGKGQKTLSRQVLLDLARVPKSILRVQKNRWAL